MYVCDIVFFQDCVHFGMASLSIILHRKWLLIPNPLACNRISYDFRPKAAQMLQMGSYGSTLKHFGPKAAQMLKMIFDFRPFAFRWISSATVFVRPARFLRPVEARKGRLEI